jgi:hypothetical protein
MVEGHNPLVGLDPGFAVTRVRRNGFVTRAITFLPHCGPTIAATAKPVLLTPAEEFVQFDRRCPPVAVDPRFRRRDRV